MLNNPTLDQLKTLKLHGMAKAFEQQLSLSDYQELSFEERFGLMVDQEHTERENRRLQSRLRQAKLRQEACMEDIDYRHPRGLDKLLMQSLFLCKWIKENLNTLICGPCGTGKSFIACALGQRACLDGYKVLYYRAPRLFNDLAIAQGDGRYNKLINTISKAHLLIIDDWGLATLTDLERRNLLEILEDRYGIHSTIIASQLPVEHWHKIIGDPTLADAILDRLVHNAYKINLKGDSMRKKKSL